MIFPETLSVLNSYFLNPVGLLALIGLLPLLIFYLIKRKPEEEVMPSMMFFMKDKKSGKVQQALRNLLRHWLLLLHILIIIGLSAAIAQPFINSDKAPESSVLVLDRSASMSNNLDAGKDFLRSNLGEQNSLIVVDNGVEIPVEQGSATLARSELASVQPVHTRSNIISGLEAAREMEGKIFVASDLKQSVTDENPENLIEQMRDSGRQVKIMEPGEPNSWGIVNVDPGRENSSVDVENFLDRRINIEIDVNGEIREISIDPNSVKTVDIETVGGRNTVELEKDRFEPDNKAFISIPEQENYDVVYIADRENPYLEKAFEIIKFTDMRTLKPPVEEKIDGEMFIIGETDKILSETVKSIESKVEKGAGLAVFSHDAVFDLGFDSLPVEQGEGSSTQTVAIQEPVRATLSTEVYNVSKTGGEDLSAGSNGIVQADYGDGQVLFYNVDDQDFRHNFLYPVFWKRTVRGMMGQASIEELNRRTGEELEAEQIKTPDGDTETGRTIMEKIGFYNASSQVYAANLVSERESSPANIGIELENASGTDGEGRRNLQNLLSLLLVFIFLGEAAYLRRIGEV